MSVDGTASQSISATDSGDYYRTAVHCSLVYTVSGKKRPP